MMCSPTAPTNDGPCSLRLRFFDALDFAMNPTGAQPIVPPAGVFQDGCGRYKGENMTRATFGFMGIAIDDSYAYFAHGLTVDRVRLDGGSVELIATGSESAWSVAVDATHLYWTTSSADINPVAVMSAPKVEMAKESPIVTGQHLAASLVVRDGFVYWANSYTLGSIQRCPVTGCVDGKPEMLADSQFYPRTLNVDGDVLFWVTGINAPGNNQIGNNQIFSCQIGNCAATIEVRDEGNINGMVVDSEAIYWLHVVATTTLPSSQRIVADVSIRRTPRPSRP
jgi:hypothetical protein